MSIARLESQKITKSDMDRYCRVDDNTISLTGALELCRYAYVAGRTDRVTDEEVEAAARVFYDNLYCPSASLDWDKAADCVKDIWRAKMRLALEAARKAVSE